MVNATGVWAGDLEPSARLAPSKGAHVIVPAARLGHPRAALTVAADGEPGRWIFALPTRDQRVIIGVTDEPCNPGERDTPSAEAGDVHVLIETINHALTTRLEPTDVIGSYAGLRPLISGQAGATADLSRRHAIIENPDSGLLTLLGGKLTTYRSMAQDAVDRIVARPGVTAGPCRTPHLPLVGAAPAAALRRIDAPERLIHRYGTEAATVLALAARDPELLAPLTDTVPVLGIELSFAIEHELALTVEDLLDRRTRIGLVPADRNAATDTATALLAPLEAAA